MVWRAQTRVSRLLWLLALVLAAAAFCRAAVQEKPQSTLVAQLTEMLVRAGGGHSPTADEIRAVEGMPGLSDAESAKEVEPLILKALSNPDAAVRRYALAMLVGMQSLPDAPAAGTKSESSTTPIENPEKDIEKVSPGPSAYQINVSKALAPLIPTVGKALVEEDLENRMMAADVLGGFSPDPPATVYAPLLGYLIRDDAVGAIGQGVVSDLLQIRTLSDDRAQVIAAYLRRSDQTPNSRADLVEMIASKKAQNRIVDKAVVGYLQSDDASLRARVILSLPALDLSAEQFAETKAKVDGIAASGQDDLQVVSAARAITGCWVQVKMAAGCPKY